MSSEKMNSTQAVEPTRKKDETTLTVKLTDETIQVIVEILGVVIACVALLVLAGWGLGLEPLKSVLLKLPTMKANTALCFLLAGSALAFHKKSWVRSVCTCLICMISGLTLAEYISSENFGLDQLLVSDVPRQYTMYPGRMIEATAIGFLMSSVSLLLLKARGHFALQVQQTLAAGVAMIGLIAVLGHAYDVQLFYRFAGNSGMALHTAVSLMVLGSGLLFARADGLSAVIISPGSGAQLMRRLLPVVVLLPVLFGWLIMKGLRYNFYGEGMDVAFLALIMIVTLSAIVWWTARTLNRSDAVGRESVEALIQANAEIQRRENELEAILDAMPAITFIAQDPQCHTMISNRRAYELLHLPHNANIYLSAPMEQRPKTFRAIKDGIELTPKQLPVQRTAATGQKINDYELTLAFDDGSYRIIYGIRCHFGMIQASREAQLDRLWISLSLNKPKRRLSKARSASGH